MRGVLNLLEKYIAMMKEGILKLGTSIDWTTEYKTMNPDYWRRTQLSFIQLYQKGFMYRVRIQLTGVRVMKRQLPMQKSTM